MMMALEIWVDKKPTGYGSSRRTPDGVPISVWLGGSGSTCVTTLKHEKFDIDVSSSSDAVYDEVKALMEHPWSPAKNRKLQTIFFRLLSQWLAKNPREILKIIDATHKNGIEIGKNDMQLTIRKTLGIHEMSYSGSGGNL